MSTQLPTAAFLADERDLLSRIARGDRRALRTVYVERSSLAMAIALRVLGHRGEAEAVVTDTFVEVWRSAKEEEARGGRSLATWIAQIARRRARTRLRSRKPGRAPPAAPAPEGPEALPLESADRRRERKRMAALLAEVPAELRRVLDQAWLSCQTIREIAELQGESTDVVSTRLQQALNKLASVLQGSAEKSA